MDIQRTARRVAICIATSLCMLVLVFVAGNAQAATRLPVKTPDTSAVLTSNNTAYLSGNNLWKKGDSMTAYIDRLGKKTPIGGVVPKKAFSLPSIASKAKTLVRGNLASIAMSAAISGMLAGVGWVMEDGVVVKSKTSVDQNTQTGNFQWRLQTGDVGNSPYEACDKLMAKSQSGDYPITRYTISFSSDTVGLCTFYTSVGNTRYNVSRQGNGCTAPANYDANLRACAITGLVPLEESDLDALDPWLNQQSAAWLSDLLKDMCVGSLKPATCFAELEVAAKQLEGPATVDGGTKTKTSTYTRPDGTMGTRTEEEQTTFDLAYGPDYIDYTTKQKTTTTEDGVKTGESTETDGDEVTQEEPQEDTQTDEDDQKEEEPEREASGDACDVPLSCSGDAIDCAVLKQEKDFRCAYEKQVDYDKHKDEIKAAITGDKFEIDDSTEIEIPSFINQGTRFLPSSCPADKSFSLKTGGGRSFVMTYEPLCAAATDLGYLIVIAVGCFCVLYVGRSLGGE